MKPTVRSAAADIRCEVAISERHMRDVVILRSICFIDELGIHPDFIFDGNDHCATHFIFYREDVPVGALRIRWFADFAKYERTCFRPAHRDPFTIKRCIRQTFGHVARKGYTRVVTQSDRRLTTLWTKLFGFAILPGEPVVLEGHPPYLTVVGTIPADPDAIRFDTNGHTLLRTEGFWDTAGNAP